MSKTSKTNLEELQKKLEKKIKRREKKKKPRMRISGKSVFELRKIIKKRAKISKNKK